MEKTEGVGIIDLFRTLHRIHRQLSDLSGRRDRAPRRVAAAEAHVQQERQLLEEAREKATALRVKSDRKQTDLQAGETKIADLQVKLNAASSNREYDTLKDQIAAIKMANSVLDDEILESWENIEAQLARVAAAETAVADAEKTAENVRKQIDHEMPSIQEDIARLQAELADAESQLPADLRVLYDRCVRERGDDALAVVDDEVCTGCYQKIQINNVANLHLGKPAPCPVCGRLIYLPEK